MREEFKLVSNADLVGKTGATMDAMKRMQEVGEKLDYHQERAAKELGKPYNKVTKAERNAVKRFYEAEYYGSGLVPLADSLALTKESAKAKHLIEKFKSSGDNVPTKHVEAVARLLATEAKGKTSAMDLFDDDGKKGRGVPADFDGETDVLGDMISKLNN